MLKNRRILFSFLSMIFVMIFSQFYNSNLTVHCVEVKEWEINESDSGYVSSYTSVVYSIMAFSVGYVRRVASSRTITLVAFGINVFGLLLMGPSKLLGFTNSFSLLMTGITLNQTATVFIVIPIIPEIISAIQE